MRSPRTDLANGILLYDGSAQPVRSAEEEVTVLFEAYRSPLLRYLLSMSLPAAEGEEVVQEVFLALYRHLRAEKPRENLRGWLFRTAHNLGLKSRLRKQPAPAPAEFAESPEEQVLEKERRRRVRAVIAALPEQDRQCLALRAEGLKFREIANVLGISLGGVALSLQRALERINRVHER